MGVSFDENQKAIVRMWEHQAREMTIFLEGQSLPIELEKQDNGYWYAETTVIKPGAIYSLLIDNQRVYHDPASLSLPLGSEGPSQAIDTSAFYWEDSCWVNPPFDAYSLFELNVATFTPEQTFSAAARHVRKLKKSGTTAVLVNPFEPVSAVAGKQGIPFFVAVYARYGGPEHFQHFVNTCHYEGLAVVIDFPGCAGVPKIDTSAATNPGAHRIITEVNALNQAQNEAFYPYYLDSALTWFRDFHIDALRLHGLEHLPHMEPALRSIRHAANELVNLTGHQYYMLVEVDEAPTNHKPLLNPVQERVLHRDYLYDPRFAAILSNLFSRTS